MRKLLEEIWTPRDMSTTKRWNSNRPKWKKRLNNSGKRGTLWEKKSRISGKSSKIKLPSMLTSMISLESRHHQVKSCRQPFINWSLWQSKLSHKSSQPRSSFRVSSITWKSERSDSFSLWSFSSSKRSPFDLMFKT